VSRIENFWLVIAEKTAISLVSKTRSRMYGKSIDVSGNTRIESAKRTAAKPGPRSARDLLGGAMNAALECARVRTFLPSKHGPVRLSSIYVRLLSMLAVALLATATSANASFSGAEDISPAGQNGFEPVLGVDTQGKAVFGWRRSTGVLTRTRSAAGALSAVQIVSGQAPTSTFLLSPQVAVDPGGNAVFAWARDDGSTQCGGGPAV
jgi:hypothetical protein